jgi:hypothetical protein
MTLNIKAFALTCGIVWGLGLIRLITSGWMTSNPEVNVD